VYRPTVARLNLHLSDALGDILTRKAHEAGLSRPAYARERLAWALGVAVGEDLEARISALEEEVARLRAGR
jgi:uncharacterized small protein (DUF1192 family)